MGSLSEEDEQFFETKQYVTQLSDSGSEGPENSDSESRVVDDLGQNFRYDFWIQSSEAISERRQRLLKMMGLIPNEEAKEDDKGEVGQNFGYDFWIQSSETISERRQRLLKMMGLIPNEEAKEDDNGEEGSIVDDVEEIVVEGDRIMEPSSASLRLSSRDLSLSSQSSISYCSSETQEMLDRALEENLVCRIKNLDDGSEFIVDELGQGGLLRSLREVGSNRPVSVEEFERMLGVSPFVQRVMGRDFGNEQASSNREGKQRTRKRWLRKLGIVAHRSFRISKGVAHNIRVKTNKKQSKELSALYLGQEMVGHEGAIRTMKFSPDGELLASSGQDGVVRIWQWTQSERSDHRFSDVDSSNIYFKVNDLGELVPIRIDEEKRGRLKSLRKSSESACVIFPRKVFGLSATPLHEFHGHEGEVLDLSWSNNKCLLSSSVDNTVRLWKVGVEQCLNVFWHNNFVTCIQFNPVDEDYFISGSIDGKVRIWNISRCEVVDWTDIKEIVTAVCYQTGGKAAVVGSISGECCFYDTSENRLQMTDQTSLHGKKKSPFRRITGFQFSPSDHSKLMVTSADSQVRILKGADVIYKYKGLRNAGSQIAASFTSDGTHIVSASEDSFVYVWDCDHSDIPISSYKVPRNKSCERFFCNDISVAIPWCGSCEDMLPSLSTGNHTGIRVKYTAENEEMEPQGEKSQSQYHRMPLFSADPFSRGVATWPEEKLTSANSLVLSLGASKSEYKSLKTTCQNMTGSPHAWGLVIVTAGWDGQIRVFQNYGLPALL